MRSRIGKLLAALCIVISCTAAAHAQAKGPLAPLDFLVGRWDPLPDATGATGWCAFALNVQDQVLVRTNHSDTPAANGRPESKHDDLMVIYAENGAAKADYYDSEGHIIRYAVQARGANDVAFVSDATASAPGYRLSYVLQSDGAVKGTFEIAPAFADAASAGKPAAWSTYLTWTMRKTRTIK